MIALGYIFGCGIVGGIINALISSNGDIILPTAIVVDKGKVIRPGVVGNMLIGGVAAVTSWGLYGPFSQMIAIDSGVQVHSMPAITVTYAALAGAILIGVGGARWLSDQVDKNLLRAAVGKAAAANANAAASQQIVNSSLPAATVLEIAQQMEHP